MPPALENPLVLWFVLAAALAGLAYAFVREELRTRAILYGAFLLACGVALWPPYETLTAPGKIKLGLDLRGGIHLVLQVVVDDALNATVDDAVQTAREQAGKKGVVIGGAQRISPTSFSVEGVEPARVKDMRDILKDFFRNDWELREPTEGKFLLEMTEPYRARLKERTVQEAIKTLERRVNQLGVAEPVIAAHGNRGDQILIQLPGVTDPEAAKRVIKTTAQLALKLVEDVAPSQETLLQARGGKVPDNMEVVSGQGDQPGQPMFYLVRREAVITGRDLKSARAGIDPQTNAPDVQFSLNPQGADKFKRETGRNVGRRLAIILDGGVASAPTIQSQISDSGVITGRFTSQEADELAKVLRAGALPATLKYLQELTVGPSLGRDSIRAGVLAAAASMAFITAFMLFYYRLSGLNAVVALSANVLILLGAMAYAGATLTLPGIAGIILTVGVGVDTNVLVFERIREELRNGKTVRAAVQNGFERVWVTILDTHATALIAAAFLFTFGTGPIKGFAVTLVWGLVANIFASYFVSKFLFEWVLGKRPVESLSIGPELIKNPNFDFLGKARYFIPLSLGLVAAGLYMMIGGGLRYGVEFSGGTQVIAKFKDAPQVDKIRGAVEQVSPGAVIQSYGEATAHQVLIRLAAAGEGGGIEGELDTTAKKVLTALAARYPDNPVLEHSSEIVGPVVGAELRRKAIWLTVFGLLFQLLYIAARFKGGIWGVAAVVACFHDVLVCIAFLGFFGYEITLNVIAALLTLVGYSVNDTIVIFDRVRENLKQRRKDSMAKILNDSVNQTLTRTLVSNGTTFLAVLGLFLFGGEVLAGFGFTMAVGILVGTYSTIYIAAPLVAWWSERTENGRRAVTPAKAAL